MGNSSNRIWDYIVIGTGMGGGTVGHALAAHGSSVLFVEKGRSSLDPNEALCGDFAETYFDDGQAPQPHHRDTLAGAGRYTDTIQDISEPGKPKPFIPFIGAGTGGSSALYGMALERFFASDFRPGEHHRAVQGSALPSQWPIGYEELAPYYRAAEKQFGVRGTPDPLRAGEGFAYEPPPEWSASNRQLAAFLSSRGMHPYHLPLASRFEPGCLTCQGFLCAKRCKIDASTWVREALRDHDAQLFTATEALRFESSPRRVEGLVVRRNGREVTLRANRYLLAAGALNTPALLLNSANTHWPNGLANTSGQVGRNLMRHLIDLYAVLTRPAPSANERIKELAFNDFYESDGEKLGSVQSFGLLPPAGVIANELARDIRHDAGALAAGAFGLVKPAAAFFLRQILKRSVLLASTLEDLPYTDNRVSLAPGNRRGDTPSLRLHYTLHEYERRRVERMREEVTTVLKPKRFLLLKQAENNERIAHVCGTARFGDDPALNVCDANQRAHGIENLYVADSSVFPSSAATNPSLTIAALSLRLAAHLASPVSFSTSPAKA